MLLKHTCIDYGYRSPFPATYNPPTHSNSEGHSYRCSHGVTWGHAGAGDSGHGVGNSWGSFAGTSKGYF